MAQVRRSEILRSIAEEADSNMLINLAIVLFGGFFAVLMFILKGVEGSISILMLILASAAIYKFMGKHTSDIEGWDTEENLDRYNRFRLQNDSRIIKNAIEGSEVYRDLLEKRLVEEVFYRLENIHDISKRRIYRYLKNDHDKLKQLLEDEYLAKFIIETKYREEISNDHFLEESSTNREKVTSSEYRRRLYRITEKIKKLS